MMQALVPAFNEAPTIGSVVATLRRAGLDVLVVDDGSSDQTAAVAEQAGGRVLALKRNRGKAGAMQVGLAQLRSDPVAMFDADLLGLRVDHVQRLLSLADQGFDMVCGLRDYGTLGNPAQLVGPLITGERIVRRWIFETMPLDCWEGYAIETAMNYACTQGGGRTALAILDGLTIRTKVDKGGWVKGLKGHYKMFSKLRRIDKQLDHQGSCKL